ncbi:hypothetical protein Ciccas_000805 [Cichlidogyrus casuarinus]|uniref:Uncharacterized protein n=1 Tax=Cichlidogyrus casuarinus TaxID=1844966 RepID=A0ABD2QLU6_9PLAT
MRWALRHLMSHITVSNFMSSNEASARAMKVAKDFLQVTSNLTSNEEWGSVKLMDFGHLQHVLTGLNLKEEFKELLPSMASQLDDTMDLYVLGNKQVELIGKFLQNLDSNMNNRKRARILNSLILVHSFLQYAPVFDEAYLEIISDLYGGITAENLNEACMVLAHHYMRPIFGYIFVNLHFDSIHTEQDEIPTE